VPTTDVGIPGAPTTTEADTDEYVLVPALLTAATLKTYDVPFVKPVTVVEAVEDAPSVNVDQVEPESDEY
jgi:hypothetical protein